MKFFLLILLIFIGGCSNEHKLNITNIQTISYNNINLIETDFDKILMEINQLEFKELKTDSNINSQLKIVSSDNIYDFKIYGNVIYYEENNKTFVSKNIENLNNILEEIEREYTNFSFFEAVYNKCLITDKDFVVKIDNTNNCLTINTSEIIYNFKINSLTLINDYLTEDGLLYQKDEIKNNNIIIKINLTNNFENKISFDTKYNYNISMLPTYNQDNNVEFNVSSVQKK